MWTGSFLNAKRRVSQTAGDCPPYHPGRSAPNLIGIALILLGFTIAFIAVFTLGHNYASALVIRENHQLISHDIYRTLTIYPFGHTFKEERGFGGNFSGFSFVESLYVSILLSVQIRRKGRFYEVQIVILGFNTYSERAGSQWMYASFL